MKRGLFLSTLFLSAAVAPSSVCSCGTSEVLNVKQAVQSFTGRSAEAMPDDVELGGSARAYLYGIRGAYEGFQCPAFDWQAAADALDKMDDCNRPGISYREPTRVAKTTPACLAAAIIAARS